MKKGTKIDVSSTWMYRRGLVTSTSHNTNILHITLMLSHPGDSGLI